MLLGIVLLYVGAVLLVNGIWLIGQATAADTTVRPPAGENAVALEAHPTFLQNREVAVINIFTGFVGLVAAVTLAVQGNAAQDIASIRASGFILLFAFTYLWVAFKSLLISEGN